MNEDRPRAVTCIDPDAHGVVWRSVGTSRARCVACELLDRLAYRSGPASERELETIAGSLTRPALEVLVATKEVRAVTLTYGFVATRPVVLPPQPGHGMPRASWEPKPPRPLNPRDDGYWDEQVEPGLTRRDAWRARTREQRARQAEARAARREELRAGAEEHAEPVVLGSQAETPHR